MKPDQTSKFPVYMRGGEIPHDAIQNKHVIVFDINMTNAYSHDLIAKRLKHEYPEFFEEILKRTFEGRLYPGSCLVQTLRGITLVGLVTHNRPFDTNYDFNETVAHHAIMAIDEMLTKVDPSREFVSSIIGRNHGIWCTLFNRIRELNLNWTVLPE